MSRLQKYFMDSSDKCTLTFQNNFPTTYFKHGHSTRGLINWNTQENLVSWKIDIQGFDDSNNLIYTSQYGASDSPYIFIDDQFNMTIPKVVVSLEIFNPEVILSIHNWFFHYTKLNNVWSYSLSNHDGLNKMTNLYFISSERGYIFNTSSVLYDIVPKLQTLFWDAFDLKNCDSRFFSVELTNLTNLILRFPYSNNPKFYNLKKAPNLNTFEYLEIDANSDYDHLPFNIEFDSNFDWQIKTLSLGRKTKPISSIPISIINLPFLEIFSIGGRHNDSGHLDLTFPLKDNQDNTVLKKLNLAWQTPNYNDQDQQRQIIYPQNIERLTALQEIYFGNQIAGDGGADIFDKFYTMFYSKIYNETDNTKEGFVISSNSSYFQSLTNPPHGFIHPTFRKHQMNVAIHGTQIPIIKTNKYNEINATGFQLIAYFE